MPANEELILSRQTRLTEVGVAGQARVSALRVETGDDAPGAKEEISYLRRAGVEHIHQGAGIPVASFAHSAEFHFEVARDIAAGAWRALGHIRQALGVGRSEA